MYSASAMYHFPSALLQVLGAYSGPARFDAAGPGSRAWGKAAAALEVVQQPHSARSRLQEAAAAALESSRELHRPRVQFEKVFSLDYLAQDGDVALQPVPVASKGDPVRQSLLNHFQENATSGQRFSRISWQ